MVDDKAHNTSTDCAFCVACCVLFHCWPSIPENIILSKWFKFCFCSDFGGFNEHRLCRLSQPMPLACRPDSLTQSHPLRLWFDEFEMCVRIWVCWSWRFVPKDSQQKEHFEIGDFIIIIFYFIFICYLCLPNAVTIIKWKKKNLITTINIRRAAVLGVFFWWFCSWLGARFVLSVSNVDPLCFFLCRFFLFLVLLLDLVVWFGAHGMARSFSWAIIFLFYILLVACGVCPERTITYIDDAQWEPRVGPAVCRIVVCRAR